MPAGDPLRLSLERPLTPDAVSKKTPEYGERGVTWVEGLCTAMTVERIDVVEGNSEASSAEVWRSTRFDCSGGICHFTRCRTVQCRCTIRHHRRGDLEAEK